MSLKMENTSFCAIIFLVLSYLLFSPSLFFPSFIFDDHFHIFDNPFILKPTISNFFLIWTESRTPVVFNLWQIVSLLFGTDSPAPFRTLNIIVHGLNAALIFKISIFLMKEKSTQYKTIASWATALIFLVHPIQVESIVWISSFRGTAAAFMALLAIFYVLNANHSHSQSENDDTLGIIPLVLFIFGLLIKPTIAPIAIILPLVDYFHHRLSFKTLIKRHTALVLTATVIGLVFQKHLLTTDYQAITFLQKIQIMFFSFFVYIKNMILPFQLAFSYNLTPIEILRLLSITKYQVGLIGFYVVLFSTFVFLIRKSTNTRLILLTSSSFFLLLLPSSGIIPFDFQNISTVANRYAYLPIAFLCLFFFAFLDEFFKFDYIKKASIFSFVILTVLNFNQIKLWSNNESILLSGQNLKNIPIFILLPLAQAKIIEKDENGARKYSNYAFSVSPDNSVSLILRKTLLSANIQDYHNTSLMLENNPQYMSHVDLFEVGQLYERLNLYLIADRFYQRSKLNIKDPTNRLKVDERLNRKKDMHIMMSYAGMIQIYLTQGNTTKVEELVKEFKELNLSPEYHHFIDQLKTWIQY